MTLIMHKPLGGDTSTTIGNRFRNTGREPGTRKTEARRAIGKKYNTLTDRSVKETL